VGPDTAGATSDPGPSPAAAHRQVELRIAWWGSTERHKRTVAALQLFERKYPSIGVKFEHDEWGAYWQRMEEYAATGRVPDVMQQVDDNLLDWARRGWLLPLDPLVKEGTIDLANAPDAFVDTGRIDGKLYGLSFGINVQSVLADVSDFERAGLSPPRDDWTWDEFEATCLRLHEALGKWCFGPHLTYWKMWRSFPVASGQAPFSRDGRALGYEDDEPFRRYLEMLVRLEAAGAIPSYSLERSEFPSPALRKEPLITGRAVMARANSNELVAARELVGPGRRISLFPLPRSRGARYSPSHVKTGCALSIASTSKHPHEAALLVDFLVNSTEANQMLLGERGVPLSTKVVEAILPQMSPAMVETVDFVNRIWLASGPLTASYAPLEKRLIKEIYYPLLIEPVLARRTSADRATALFRREASALLAGPAP
jgi:multiple sugar transport system substrate-binding protein